VYYAGRDDYLGEGAGVADKYCGNCGQELRPGVRFCPSCGQPTVASEMPAAEGPVQPPPRRGGWSAGRILLLVIVAPVLLAVAVWVFLFAIGFLSGLLGG
jgi:hypothetical protein